MQAGTGGTTRQEKSSCYIYPHCLYIFLLLNSNTVRLYGVCSIAALPAELSPLHVYRPVSVVLKLNIVNVEDSC